MKAAAPNDEEAVKAMQAAFEDAMAARIEAVSEHHCTVAGIGIRLRIAGRRLAEEITPPFDHLRSGAPAGKPGLTIDVWDQEETGVEGIPGGTHDGEEAFSVLTASSEGRYVAEERHDRMSWLDRRAGHVVGYMGSADRLYVHERARPFQRLLSVWFNDRKIQLIHSGLVSWEGRGVLFVGMGGAGKTTSSISCLLDGFGYLGDDFLGLEETPDGSFTGYGIYASCLLTPEHLTQFPDLMPHAGAANHAHEDKSFVYLSRLFPERMEQSIAIGVLALPRVVDADETSFRPASKGEALLALAPTSVMFLPGANVRSLDKLARLVERVPCYWLELGRDINHIPDTVRRMVAAAEQT